MFRYLRPEDVRRLESFEFAAKMLAEGWLAGRHRSRLRGASSEFHEYRAYSEGDPPTLVDWRVFARTDRHYIKTFERETNLECHLLVDGSSSMGFRGGAALSKLEFASYFSAALAWLVMRGADRASLQIFDREIRVALPPGSTRKHLHALLTELERNTPQGETAVAHALERAALQLKRRGTLVVLSDFYEPPGPIFEALNAFVHRGFKVHLFHLLTPEEMDLGQGSLARFVDSENRKQLVLHPRHVADSYREVLADHISRLRELAGQRQIDYAVARCDGSHWGLLDRIGGVQGMAVPA